LQRDEQTELRPLPRSHLKTAEAVKTGDVEVSTRFLERNTGVTTSLGQIGDQLFPRQKSKDGAAIFSQ